MKKYIGISLDYSASMRSVAPSAAKDYNENIQSIKESSKEYDIDTIVSVIKCGFCESAYSRATSNVREIVNSNVDRLKPIKTYQAYGSNTPLFDSVGELIEILSSVPDANDPKVSFLITVITDGQDNSSVKYNAHRLQTKIRQLQGTDRWSFVFRVPKNHKHRLMMMGIPEGNILEWETTSRGMEQSTIQTKAAFKNHYSAIRSKGVTSTSSFYSDLSNVKACEVRAEMKNITKEVKFWRVNSSYQIRDFVESKLRKPMTLGCAFYQLTKPEKAVQDYKLICIRNKNSGAVYGGDMARELLRLPKNGDIKLAPGNHGEFDVFVQSTSTNRKLIPNTEVLYWSSVMK